MSDADYMHDLVFLAQAESLLYSLKQAARGIGINVNSDNT